MPRPSLALFALFSVALVAQAQPAPEGTPQPRLPVTSLTIEKKQLVAEVADDSKERETGMMFRKTMPDGEAMVFVFDAPQRAAFWMKNTLLPLSVAYVSLNGTILEIHDLKPRDETPVPSKFDTIAYAIEVPQGWFLENGILPGSSVKGLPRPAGQ